jgi:hypothetical protein
MRVCVLDLDGSVVRQEALLKCHRADVVDARAWGRRIRLGCSFGRFRRFEQALPRLLGHRDDPAVVLYGSGDFHHVSLALLRRRLGPCNLLLLDKHPDWMRLAPLLHCGTWVHHAAQLPELGRIFHVGGDLDFDNAYRWLAPWPLLQSGRVVVIPAVRRFCRGRWRAIAHTPLREEPQIAASPRRVAELLRPHAAELASRPLYISVDKDVLREADATVNWDSGYLELAEVCAVIRAFRKAAPEPLAGVDLLGDWSPVCVQGLLRRALDLVEHPRQRVDVAEADRRNERANRTILEALTATL